MMKTQKVKKAVAFAVCAALFLSTGATAFAANTVTDPAFTPWKANVWDNKAQFDSGHVVLTPGKDATQMNFAWYSAVKGTPQVKISTKSDMSGAQCFTGTATTISAANGTNSYAATNKATVTGLAEKTAYYYSYSTDGTAWSTPAAFNTQSSSALKMIYVGDPQIGASGKSDSDIANDTYQWNNTLQTAVSKNPDTNFILSAGDQINQADVKDASKIRRELEYAGFLYPAALRSLPVATTIGNHESLDSDYSQHYNNPNSGANLGATASGCDYYFNYGNVLFIVLNSNNRSSAEHDQLMSAAVNDSASKNAKWKIVMFHHDVYGSGIEHSDIDGANLRALFAPLMDKYNIDVCLTGHDHSYSRSFQMLDGKAINYQSDKVTDPQGTLYVTADSASGSKFYTLSSAAQYYINKSSQTSTPNYSTIAITDSNFTIQTFDVANNAQIDSYTISKSSPKQSLKNLIAKANTIVTDKAFTTTYTDASRKTLLDSLNAANALLETDKDSIPTDLFGNYDKTIQGDNAKDKLNYYGYDSRTGKRVETGYCDFIDKTMNESQKTLTTASINQISTSLSAAISGLTKPSQLSSPKTGDQTTVFVTILIAGLSLTILAVITYNRNKRRENS
ncbi:MAG TPA: metallophosphoesterase family protein [Oscillospiraceae bacterium]|nr:metallophosphoesterase family protein [Oscillospiraceae bacterium]